MKTMTEGDIQELMAPFEDQNAGNPQKVEPSNPLTEELKDPAIVGDLDLSERSQLTQLQQHANNSTMEIGRLFVNISRLLGSIEDAEERATAVMETVRSRLGIPKGTPWQVTRDFKARVLDLNSVVPAPSENLKEEQKNGSRVGTTNK